MGLTHCPGRVGGHQVLRITFQVEETVPFSFRFALICLGPEFHSLIGHTGIWNKGGKNGTTLKWECGYLIQEATRLVIYQETMRPLTQKPGFFPLHEAPEQRLLIINQISWDFRSSDWFGD